jgi:TRAP-type C4-dicarboxylate transport system substrate-binding protein
MEAGDLDGTISGGPICSDIMPAMRVMYVVGLFKNQDEVRYVMSQIESTLRPIAHARGYHLVTTASVGTTAIFSGKPLRTMDEVRGARLWSWDLDEPITINAQAMGMHIVPLPLDEASRAYDDGRIDGFISTPSAALAFQWFAQTKYITNLNLGFLEGCLLFREKSMDPLSVEDQQAIDVAGAALGVRIDRDNVHMESQLLGSAFANQGLEMVAVSEKLTADFYAAARAAREQLGEKLVDKDVLGKVMGLLADYRAEHH